MTADTNHSSTPNLHIAHRDRPKFGFGAENNNLNSFGQFGFQPNIDQWLLAKIRFQPKKFHGFRRSAESSHRVNDIPDWPDRMTAWRAAVTACSCWQVSLLITLDTAVDSGYKSVYLCIQSPQCRVVNFIRLQPIRRSRRATLQSTITCVTVWLNGLRSPRLVCLLQKLISNRQTMSHWAMLTNDWRLATHPQTVPHSQLAVALFFAWDLHCALRLHSLFCENYNVAKSLGLSSGVTHGLYKLTHNRPPIAARDVARLIGLETTPLKPKPFNKCANDEKRTSRLCLKTVFLCFGLGLKAGVLVLILVLRIAVL